MFNVENLNSGFTAAENFSCLGLNVTREARILKEKESKTLNLIKTYGLKTRVTLKRILGSSPFAIFLRFLSFR